MNQSQNSKNRIIKDYEAFLSNPIEGCHVAMREGNLYLWDAIIMWEIVNRPIPLHLLIAFPQDYPTSAPSVGFSCSNIGYQDGATSIEQSPTSPLKGKLTICLDILGNFAQYHKEWASTAKSGWSPAYTVSSLLVNLQAVLGTCALTLDGVSNERIKRECELFMRNFNSSDMCPPINN